LYHKETIEEELRLTAKLFCESNERVYISDNEIVLPQIMSTYICDFAASGISQDLLLTMSKYLSKERCELLRKVLQDENESATVHFQNTPMDTGSKNQKNKLKSKWTKIPSRGQKQKRKKHNVKNKFTFNSDYNELHEVQTSSTQENSSSDHGEKSTPTYIVLSNTQYDPLNPETPTTDDTMTFASQFSLTDIADDYSIGNWSKVSLDDANTGIYEFSLKSFGGNHEKYEELLKVKTPSTDIYSEYKNERPISHININMGQSTASNLTLPSKHDASSLKQTKNGSGQYREEGFVSNLILSDATDDYSIDNESFEKNMKLAVSNITGTLNDNSIFDDIFHS